MKQEISIKDVYSQVSEMKGQMDFLVKLATQVNNNEKEIIRLQEYDKQIEKEFISYKAQIETDLKAHRDTLRNIETTSRKSDEESRKKMEELSAKVVRIMTIGGVIIGALTAFSDRIINAIFQ